MDTSYATDLNRYRDLATKPSEELWTVLPRKIGGGDLAFGRVVAAELHGFVGGLLSPSCGRDGEDDQRAVSSIYIASDSRITWADSHLWSQGRKTFAASETPHIFGYWGDVLFPTIALPTVIDELAAGIIRSRGRAFGDVGNSIRRLWMDFPKQEQRDLGIVMATRRREAMDSVFELAVMTYEAATGTWDVREVEMPRTSARLHIAGSGASEVRNATTLWEQSIEGGTSRAIYSAFTEALAEGADPYSGGAPQLVGLQRIGPGIRFGTIYRSNRYLAGARVTQKAARFANVKWFNELFERSDGVRGRRLVNAQCHNPR